MVKVFFNNSCNICRAEINHYKKHSDNSVEWIDVTNNEEAQKVTSKSYKELLRSCLLYTSPSPRDTLLSRMPSSA